MVRHFDSNKFKQLRIELLGRSITFIYFIRERTSCGFSNDCCGKGTRGSRSSEIPQVPQTKWDSDDMERLVPGQFAHLITTVISWRSVAFLAQLQLQRRRVVETTDTTLFVHFIFAGHVISDRCEHSAEREARMRP